MVDSSKRIGILGGSFNPVHLGHLHLAKELKLRCQLDEIWFVPVHQNPHKLGLSIVSSEHRLEMLQLATRGTPSYRVVDVECKRKGPSYTVDTLKHLHREYPDNDFFLLLGSDTIKRFHDWKDPCEVLNLSTLVVASRYEGGVALDYGDAKLEEIVSEAIIPIKQLNASSTEIRSLIQKGEKYQHLVPPLVCDYIQKHRLYIDQ